MVLSRLQKADVAWNLVDSAIWFAADPCMGVISSCESEVLTLQVLLTVRALSPLAYGPFGAEPEDVPWTWHENTECPKDR